MRLSWRKPSEISLVVVVEAEGLDGYDKQRFSDMWRGLLLSSGCGVISSGCFKLRGQELAAFLRDSAYTFHKWFLGQSETVAFRYGPQPDITKFELWICWGNVVSAPEGRADVIAVLDLLEGNVLP